MTAGRFFDLRSTFPDLDYRAHDYRLAASPSQDGDGGASNDAVGTSTNEVVVRFTTRTVGTMQGELKLRRETLPPNGEKMICPPGEYLYIYYISRVRIRLFVRLFQKSLDI